MNDDDVNDYYYYYYNNDIMTEVASVNRGVGGRDLRLFSTGFTSEKTS